MQNIKIRITKCIHSIIDRDYLRRYGHGRRHPQRTTETKRIENGGRGPLLQPLPEHRALIRDRRQRFNRRRRTSSSKRKPRTRRRGHRTRNRPTIPAEARRELVGRDRRHEEQHALEHQATYARAKGQAQTRLQRARSRQFLFVYALFDERRLYGMWPGVQASNQCQIVRATKEQQKSRLI